MFSWFYFTSSPLALISLVCDQKSGQKTTLVLLLVGLLASSGGFVADQQLLNLTSNVNGHSNYTEFEMAVYVKKDSDIKDIKEIKEVVAPKGNNNEANLTALLDNIKNTVNM